VTKKRKKKRNQHRKRTLKKKKAIRQTKHQKIIIQENFAEILKNVFEATGYPQKVTMNNTKYIQIKLLIKKKTTTDLKI